MFLRSQLNRSLLPCFADANREEFDTDTEEIKDALV